jgi:uncharacterized protein (TIGR02118 family)
LIKLTVLYGHPTDPAAFEEYYANTHMPLAGKMSGIEKVETAKVVGTPDGGKPDFYRSADLYFSDQEAMAASMGSPEGQATTADIGNFATGGATVLISAVD